MKTGATIKIVAILALALASVLLLVGCSSDDEDSSNASPGSSVSPNTSEGSGGGGSPPANLVTALRSLPLFPGTNLTNGQYPTGGSTGDYLLTGFNVSPGTNVDDVLSFFGKNLPSAGWQEEAEPTTEAGEKEGSVVRTVIWTFLKEEVRLAIEIPLINKDASPGVITVRLILAPKGLLPFSSPVATPDPSEPTTPVAATAAN